MVVVSTSLLGIRYQPEGVADVVIIFVDNVLTTRETLILSEVYHMVSAV